MFSRCYQEQPLHRYAVGMILDPPPPHTHTRTPAACASAPAPWPAAGRPGGRQSRRGWTPPLQRREACSGERRGDRRGKGRGLRNEEGEEGGHVLPENMIYGERDVARQVGAEIRSQGARGSDGVGGELGAGGRRRGGTTRPPRTVGHVLASLQAGLQCVAPRRQRPPSLEGTGGAGHLATGSRSGGGGVGGRQLVGGRGSSREGGGVMVEVWSDLARL